MHYRVRTPVVERLYLKITREDAQIQAIRWERQNAISNAARQVCGWSIGRGYEGDLFDARLMSETMMYQEWLRVNAS